MGGHRKSGRKRPASQSLESIQDHIQNEEQEVTASTASEYNSSWHNEVEQEFEPSARYVEDPRFRRRRQVFAAIQNQIQNSPNRQSESSEERSRAVQSVQPTDYVERHEENTFENEAPLQDFDETNIEHPPDQQPGSAGSERVSGRTRNAAHQRGGESNFALNLSNESRFSSDQLDVGNELEIYDLNDQRKDFEIKRMRDILHIIQTGGLSQRQAAALLRTDVIGSQFSYEALVRHAIRRSGVRKQFGLMCSSEHAPLYRVTKEERCPSQVCEKMVSESHRYWYRFVSDQLSSLCRAEVSFRQMMRGCEEAWKAITGRSEVNGSLHDYYCGDYFKTKFGGTMRSWDAENELHVFLTFSSDGFEVFRGRRLSRSTWPLIFVVLNLDPVIRFQASNAMMAGFVPDSHDPDQFERFMLPIVEDLKKMETGMRFLCADGKERSVYGHLMFVTADWPAASKLTGMKGHNAQHPCRMCMKQARRTDPSERNLWMLPEVENELHEYYHSGRLDGERSAWIDRKCPHPRTAADMKRIWDRLKERGRGKAAVMKASGVRRKPLLSTLSIDIVRCCPYDPMHLWLLGWVKHVLSLCIGSHKRCTSYQYPFVLQQTRVEAMNEALSQGATGFPSQWGRPPESFHYLSGYKAEDYMNFALYYAPVLFGASGVNSRLVQLWAATSTVTDILMDTAPTTADVVHLRQAIQVSHTLFIRIFYSTPAHAFCLTPTTHAILHLPQILQSCGSLRNVSQFIVERIAGKLGDLASSRHRPEANLFHKTHMLFAMRMLDGGIWRSRAISPSKVTFTEAAYETDMPVVLPESRGVQSGALRLHQDAGATGFASDDQNSGFRLHFSGKPVLRHASELRSVVVNHAQIRLSQNCYDVRLTALRSFPRVTISQGGSCLTVETRPDFERRQRNETFRARQRCWIASKFEAMTRENLIDREEESCEVYYGCVEDILEASIEYRKQGSNDKQRTQHYLVYVRWQNGLRENPVTDIPSVSLQHRVRRGSVNDTEKTVEDIQCVSHLIAIMDFEGRRHFLDPMRRRISTGVDVLGGLL